nr:hypothetical protein [Methanomassiliicoccus luminyensis]
MSNGDSHLGPYMIYRSTTSGEEASMSPPIPFSYSTSYTDTDVVDGVTYYYKVTATNRFGEGPMSNEASGKAISSTTPSESGPSAPTGVTASISDGQIVISWHDPINTGGLRCNFEVYRGISPNWMELLMGSRLQGTYGNSYTDTTAEAGQLYYYYVVAVNSNGQDSEPSTMVTANKPFTLPPNYNSPPNNNDSWVFPMALTIAVVAIAIVTGILLKKKRTPPQNQPPMPPEQ